MSKHRTKRTPSQVARDWGVSDDKVLGWIRTGELRAVNAATKPGGRPRYLIDEKDLADFEVKRSVVPKPRIVRRSPTKNAGIVPFF